MNLYELIRRKRDRGRLTGEEIAGLVDGYTRKEVPDYQMAALLMAVWFRGMDADETATLTLAMMNSGKVFDLSSIPGSKIDKHSTGGVGDKVSLILAPLMAACGVLVPMVSGRSLGHTGGTLDKLESIPGFRTQLGLREFRLALEQVGCAMMGQTEEMCPADRGMYALRDATATVDSIPLIAASIMSKKLAEGIDGLVLDVKTGGGAFMTRPAQARRLARTMVRIGTKLGKRVVALVTSMDEPLGETVGNSLEVIESIEALKGRWRPDLEQVTLALGVEMLRLAGRAGNTGQARRLVQRALAQGKALDRFRKMVEQQGGDPQVVDDYSLLPLAKGRAAVKSESNGCVRRIDALQVGMLGRELGIGRATIASAVEHGTGFRFVKKIGDRVSKGEVLAEVLGRDEQAAQAIAEQLRRCITVGAGPVRAPEVVLDRIAANREKTGRA